MVLNVITEIDYSKDINLSDYDIILFSASWCKKCKEYLEELKKENRELTVLKLDMEDLEDSPNAYLIEKYQIKALPYIIKNL